MILYYDTSKGFTITVANLIKDNENTEDNKVLENTDSSTNNEKKVEEINENLNE